MGNPQGFLKLPRKTCEYRPVGERVNDYKEVTVLKTEPQSKDQASRCMDCGTPFCHSSCPIGNLIPEWNDDAYHGRWKKAFSALKETNNFPEITGRVCPALCESGCVLGINDDPVTIRENELFIIENAFDLGIVRPDPPKKRTGYKVAVIGSGPSGLAAADELNKKGHTVTVLEKDEKIGGILRYGIPDFKLDKSVLDRRIGLLKKEGIKFITGTEAGDDIPSSKLLKEYDAVCICIGARKPRDLLIPGRDLKGIHLAMDYLCQSNRRVSGEKFFTPLIDAKDKKVLVIGGGDTGSDCVGTANRQGASCVTQIEIMPKPPVCRPKEVPWPRFPILLKTTSSHEEGSERKWSVLTKSFEGVNGQVKSVSCIAAEFIKDPEGCSVLKEVPGSEFVIEADMVVLALGFVHPEQDGLVKDLKLKLDARGNIACGPSFMTSRKGVFACGDARRGASLVVWAIYEGRQAAEQIDPFLKKL